MCLTGTSGFEFKKTISAAPKTDFSFVVGTAVGLVPHSWLQPLATLRPAWDVSPVLGFAASWAPVQMLWKSGMLHWDYPYSSVVCASQPLTNSFHAVSYRLLFIGASLPPHY